MSGKDGGYILPAIVDPEKVCIQLNVPNEREHLAAFWGALWTLTRWYNWQREDTHKGLEVGAIWRDIWFEAQARFENGLECSNSVPTPFWDEDADVDDDASAETQTWYGYVEDPEAPADELTFIEQATIWAFTGFIAFASFEVAFAPAILFHTIAPKFVLAMKRGDVGEVIRIVIDGNEAARVDTTSAAVGDVIRTPIIADPAISLHDIMLVQVS